MGGWAEVELAGVAERDGAGLGKEIKKVKTQARKKKKARVL